MSRLFVLLYKDTPNPKNFPGDYPAEAIEYDENAPEFPKSPWVKMDRETYKHSIESLSDQVRSINQQIEEQEKTDAQNLALSTKTSLEEISAHAEAVESDATSITTEDRFAMVDTMAVTLSKFGPLLEKLLEQFPDLSKQP